MTELQTRIKSTTPQWFKRIRRAGVIVTAVAGALIAAKVTVPGFVLPNIVDVVSQWVVVAGITASTVATTAKEDK